MGHEDLGEAGVGRGPAPSGTKGSQGRSPEQGPPLWPDAWPWGMPPWEGQASMPRQHPPCKRYSAPHPPLPWPPAAAVSLKLPRELYNLNAHCSVLACMFVGGPRGLSAPFSFTPARTSSSRFLPQLLETPHAMNLESPRPRLTTPKGTLSQRGRGAHLRSHSRTEASGVRTMVCRPPPDPGSDHCSQGSPPRVQRAKRKEALPPTSGGRASPGGSWAQGLGGPMSYSDLVAAESDRDTGAEPSQGV